MKLILDKLNTGAMPPPKMPRPKPEDVTAVTQWLSHQLATEPEKNAAPGDTTTPAQMKSGGVTARRLNRIEYDNTVRDLLGVDLHAGAQRSLLGAQDERGSAQPRDQTSP